MRAIFILLITFFLTSCGIEGGINRGYIISHSETEDSFIEYADE